MRALKLLLAIAVVAWALLTFGVVQWVRERHGRGGPIPVSQGRALLHPLRRFLQPLRPTLERFAIRQGDTVLELGPGPGYFTLEAARMAGAAGRVLCLDLQRGMLDMLQTRLGGNGAANAHPVLADATRLPLADGCVDAAYLVAVLGEVPDRVAALLELRRVLKSGGRLSFAETLTDPDYVFQRELRDLCRATGFEPLETSGQPLGYTMTFRRP